MASTRAKRVMESQAVSPEGKGRAREAANAIKRKPAGMVRKAETKKGPHFGITSFMATIAVPQKKNGETSTAHSHTNSNIPSSSSSSLEFSSKIATALLLSCPVLTESKPTASCSCCFSSKSVLVVSLEHLTIISLKPVKFFLFLTLLLVLVFLL